MPHFSEKSIQRLQSCDQQLQRLCYEVIKYYDFTVLEGHRSKQKQQEYLLAGKTTLSWPRSKHNVQPSLAVDIVPYPVDWQDRKRFYYLAGLMMATAYQMQISLRWGGDWNRNGKFYDQSFYDLPHFELI